MPKTPLLCKKLGYTGEWKELLQVLLRSYLSQ